MHWIRLPFLVAVAAFTILQATPADRPAADPAAGAPAVAKLPPVLRPTEPPDTRFVALPGPPPVTPALKLIKPLAPIAKAAPLPAKLSPDPALLKPLPVPAPLPLTKSVAPSAPAATAPLPATPAAPAPPTIVSPSEMRREIADFCQKQIGHWKQSEARKILGEPTRHRPAYDEKQAVNGTIFAFSDPTGHYKELELDFDRQTGNLRSVFVYPLRLTWQECRKLWDGPVSAADANQGRKFYSYSNRRLDVLVDPSGKVISLGWY